MNKTLAQLVNPVLSPAIGGGPNPSTDMGLVATGRFVSSMVSLLLIVAALAALLFMVLGGLQWITAGSDKAKLEQARERITQAIIGLIVVAAAWAVWLLIGNFLGIDFEHIPFPTLV